jgi:hypothetical protein
VSSMEDAAAAGVGGSSRSETEEDEGLFAKYGIGILHKDP